MSDVKDILGFTPVKEAPSTGSAVDSILKKKVSKTPNKESTRGQSIIDKLQSTFRALEGETLSFASPISQQVFKEKRKIKVHFEKRGFRNNARKDNLVLYHWAKSSDKIEDYKYAKFNKKMEVLVYTEEEYDLYLRDPNWTKEDTDLLLELCQRYDTRFIIVHDRFESSVARSVEDLKERYYKIQSKLVELRTKAEEDPYHNPLTGYNFNKVYEVERKLQADQLFQLTKEQVQEENELSEKYFNIERHLLKHSKESKSIMKLASIAISNGPLKNYSTQDLAEKQQSKDDSGASGSGSAVKKGKKRKSLEPSLSSLQELDSKMSPVAIQRQSNRIETTLFEMHIGQPYSNNTAKRIYNDLKQDMMILLDLQRYFIEKRYHLEILKKQKEYLEKEIEEMNIPPEALLLDIEEEVVVEQPQIESATNTTTAATTTTTTTTTPSSNAGEQPQQPMQHTTPFQIYGTGISDQVSSSSIDLLTGSSSSVIAAPPATPKQQQSMLSGSVDSTSSSSVATPSTSEHSTTSSSSTKKSSKKKAKTEESSDAVTTETESSSTKKKKTPSKPTKKQLAAAAAAAAISEATDNFTINVEGMSDDQSSTSTTTPKPTKRKSKKESPAPSSSDKKSSSSSKKKSNSSSKKKTTPNLNLSPLPPPQFTPGE